MTINFKSIIFQNEEEKTIEFTTQVKESNDFGFNVLEFKEPQSGIMNRIEISDRYINIFAGTSTLNLELETPVTVRYQLSGQIINMVTTMTSLEISDTIKEFKYNIKTASGDLIGEYHLTLTIKK